MRKLLQLEILPYFLLIFYYSIIYFLEFLQSSYFFLLLPAFIVALTNFKLAKRRGKKAINIKGESLFYLLLMIFFVSYYIYFPLNVTLVSASHGESISIEDAKAGLAAALEKDKAEGPCCFPSNANAFLDHITGTITTGGGPKQPDGGTGGDGNGGDGGTPTPTPTPPPTTTTTPTPGTSGGACRPTEPKCNAPLVCNPATNVCVTPPPSCSLSSTSSVGFGLLSLAITAAYRNLASAPNSITINCGDGSTATAANCIGTTGSCSAVCNYPSVTSPTTYTVSASTAGIQCSTTEVTNTPLSKACGISFSLNQITNFDTTSKTGNYIGNDYTWTLKGSDLSSDLCPASLIYSIPTNSIVTIGSCDKSTGIYPISENPPSGSKINSFTISRAKSADILKVYVKPVSGLCTFSFGINGPDGKSVDPIFTVSTDGDVGGTCNSNAICESGENQQSCPGDCSTKITLGTTQLYPGSDVKITIDIKDGRYTKNDKIQLHLFIDGVIWDNKLCPISSDSDDNVELNPLAKPSGVSITSNDRNAIIEATCKVPDNISAGKHKLRVIPTILPVVLPPVET